MSECLVTGLPNVGKTCFVINFAEYMGLKELKFNVRQTAGYTSITTFSPVEARRKLISVDSNYTREIQSIKMEIPVGKSFKELNIIDSCGLSSGINPDEEVRLAMAKTIRLLRASKMVLHIIDITNIRTTADRVLLPVDKLIMDYASLEKNYAVLVNKMDLLSSHNNLEVLRKKIRDKIIIPISALYQTGFKEVKKLVLSYV